MTHYNRILDRRNLGTVENGAHWINEMFRWMIDEMFRWTMLPPPYIVQGYPADVDDSWQGEVDF